MSHLRKLYYLMWKNLHLLFRDRKLFLLSILTPIVLLGIFTFAFLGQEAQTSYKVGIVNNDTPGQGVPPISVVHRVSFDYIQALDEITYESNGEIIDLFTITSVQDATEAIHQVQKKKLDVVIIIPEDFSERIIGSTWWYQMLVAENFTNTAELLEQNSISPQFAQTVINMLNGTHFPAVPPNLTIYSNEDYIRKTVLTNAMNLLLRDLILTYNNLELPHLNEMDLNENFVPIISIYDNFMPLFIVTLCLIPISTLANMIIKERDNHTLDLVNSTLISQTSHFLASI